jgi:hypothetical protein
MRKPRSQEGDLDEVGEGDMKVRTRRDGKVYLA